MTRHVELDPPGRATLCDPEDMDVDRMLTAVWRCVERGEHFTLEMFVDTVRRAREIGWIE